MTGRFVTLFLAVAATIAAEAASPETMQQMLVAGGLTPFEHECKFRASSCNTTVTDTVNIFGCATTPGRNYVNFHRITIPAKRRVTVTARSSSFSTLLVLFDSGPAIIRQANAPRNSTASLTYETIAGEEFTIGIAPVEDFGTGTYTLSITCERIDDVTPPTNCSACVPTANTACMLNNRFRVTMIWRDVGAFLEGNGRLITYADNKPVSDPINGETSESTFWSMYADNPNSIEALVRLIRGFDTYWVFVTGFASAEYTVTVQDTKTCATWRRTVPTGSTVMVKDFGAFPFP